MASTSTSYIYTYGIYIYYVGYAMLYYVILDDFLKILSFFIVS